MENLGVDGKINIKIYIMEIEYKGVGWINLTLDRDR